MKVAHMSWPPKNELVPETHEAQLLSQLECLDGEEKLLLKEIDILKSKVAVNAGYGRVVELEKELKERTRQDTDLAKRVRNGNKALSRRDKQYHKQLVAQENAPPVQKEASSPYYTGIRRSKFSVTSTSWRMRREPWNNDWSRTWRRRSFGTGRSRSSRQK